MKGTVLVTGCAGFIGPTVVKLLLEWGYTVIGYDKLTYAARVDDVGGSLSLRMVLNGLQPDQRGCFTFVRGDVVEVGVEFQALVDKCAFVLHLAAESHVDRSTDGKPEFIRTEIGGTYTLAEALRCNARHNVAMRVQKAVIVSTDEVYGSVDRISEHEGSAWWKLSDRDVTDLIARYQFREDMPLRGGSPYAATKGGADLLVLAYWNTFKLPLVLTRGCNCFPANGFQHCEKLVPMAICTLLMPRVDDYLRKIPIYDRGLAVREWQTTEDYASAIIYAMEMGAPGDLFNVGSGNRCRNRDLLLAIWKACWRRGLVREFSSLAEATFDASTTRVEARPGHDLCYAVDCTRILRAGWTPKDSGDFEARVDQAVNWYDSNRHWWEPIWTSEDFTAYWNRKYAAIADGQGPFSFYSSDDERRSLKESLL